jgi:hypothetical protein
MWIDLVGEKLFLNLAVRPKLGVDADQESEVDPMSRTTRGSI